MKNCEMLTFRLVTKTFEVVIVYCIHGDSNLKRTDKTHETFTISEVFSKQ